MKPLKIITLFLILSTLKQLNANALVVISANDSLTLGEAFVNLSLTGKYFDTLKIDRITKIIRFEESELASITDKVFIKKNIRLYNFTQSLLYYAKAKQLFLNKKDISRKRLLLWKKTLEISIDYFNKADIESIVHNFDFYSYYEFIGFSKQKCENLANDIKSLKLQFSPYFNTNIYPDFKRIFLEQKQGNSFDFNSLQVYTKLFNIQIEPKILNLIPSEQIREFKGRPSPWYIDGNYLIDLRLDLISRYLQLNHIAKNYKFLCNIRNILYEFEAYKDELMPENVNGFSENIFYLKDSFFQNNLNIKSCDELFLKLNKIITPDNCPESIQMVGMGLGPKESLKKYYFPIPVPFPSALKYTYNFKPSLSNMGQVDNYIKNIFYNAGYKNHTQYYYLESGAGYAMTTSLEGTDKDGTPVNIEKRWDVSVKGYNKFTLYETYKAIFFNTESNFRIFALVVSPSAAPTESKDSISSIGRFKDLETFSYPTLPKDLENLVLPQKVLSIFVYNFYQNSRHQVPAVDRNYKLSVETHLKKSGLAGLLK